MKIQQLVRSLLKGNTRGIEYGVVGGVALLTASWLVDVPAVQAARRDLVHRTAAEYGSVAADYDGDGRSDISVKRDGGTWQIDLAANGFGGWDGTYRGYGGLEAIPVPADYDGDHKADLSVKTTAGVWYIDYAHNGFGTWDAQFVGYGDASARPVPADYDGDGKADLSVWDDFGVWHIDYARNGFGTWEVHVLSGFNGPTAEPVPADYDGDGKADLSVKNDSGGWIIDYARDGFGPWDVGFSSYGDAFARPVPADYDGDGKADLSVKEDAGTWRIDYAANGFGVWDASFVSVAGRPIPGNYNLTAGADLAVRADCGPWYIRPSSGNALRWQRIDSTDAWRNTVTVRDRYGLLQTLRSDFQGVINIPTSIEVTGPWSLDPNDLSLRVNSCTRLKGTRGGLDPGALLFDTNRTDAHAAFVVYGHDVKIEGLRLRGPSQGNRNSSQPWAAGIEIRVDPTIGTGRNVLMTNNELWHWTEAGVSVTSTSVPRMASSQASHVSVLRNYFHDNARENLGYGVVVWQGAYALIEGNLFDRNRHAIAASWGPSNGYIARYNYILAGGYTVCEWWGCYYNQHFDVHGEFGGYGGRAGGYFSISSNTFRGEQTWILGQPTRAAFLLRGKPTMGAYFYGNVVVHNNAGEAARTKNAGCGTNVNCNLIIGVNSYNTDLSLDAAVAGDLDGDGLDDIFLANGTGWWYSSAGRTEWRFLRPSSLRLAALRFGDFDGDGRADVLETRTNLWQYYPRGTNGPIVLRAYGSALTPDHVLGDFDGNGKTDVLWTTGSQWYLSLNSNSAWSSALTSPIRGPQLRVGNFDADVRDEVFFHSGSWWAAWNYGSNGLALLRPALTSDVSSLVVADFNADGRSDIAQTSGNGWRYSSGGTSNWLSLPGANNLPYYYGDIRKALIGHFNGDGRADAVRFQMTLPFGSSVWVPHDQATFVGWNGISSGFTTWSGIPMR